MYCLVQFIDCEVNRPRGVAISKSSLYVQGKDFRCFDGSSTIPFDHVNDNYCDCKDASDEPGTSACPNGSFHCTNAGHKPLYIPSSRVNDGICDCCDATDEYDSPGLCQNMCRELGRAAREEAERLKKLIEEGHELYKEYIELGTDAKVKNEATLTDLKAKKSEAETRKTELQQIKEEAEIPEKEAKDAHQARVDEEKNRLDALKTDLESSGAFEDLDKNQDGMVSVDEMQAHTEFDIDSNGDVSQEEAKEYLEDQESIDAEFFKTNVWPNIKAIFKMSDVMPPSDQKDADDQGQTIDPVDEGKYDQHDEDDKDYDSDDDDDEGYYGEDGKYYHGDETNDEGNEEVDDDEVDGADVNGENEKGNEGVPDYDDQTKLLISVADKARADFNEADTQFKNVEREFQDLEKVLQLDFGPNHVYYPLKGSCYEFTDREYVYKLCPFDKASQRGKSGGSETSLGKWGHWDGPDNNPHSVMKYDNGLSCWNGPNRSVRVKVKCGLSNELTSATEPNKCEYEFGFLSPAACNEQVKIAAFQPGEHDEL